MSGEANQLQGPDSRMDSGNPYLAMLQMLARAPLSSSSSQEGPLQEQMTKQQVERLLNGFPPENPQFRPADNPADYLNSLGQLLLNALPAKL